MLVIIIMVIMEPSLRTARPSRATLLLIGGARCTVMEPALELTACAEEIPQPILIPILGLAISVLAVREDLYCNFSLRATAANAALLSLSLVLRF